MVLRTALVERPSPKYPRSYSRHACSKLYKSHGHPSPLHGIIFQPFRSSLSLWDHPCFPNPNLLGPASSQTYQSFSSRIQLHPKTCLCHLTAANAAASSSSARPAPPAATRNARHVSEAISLRAKYLKREFAPPFFSSFDLSVTGPPKSVCSVIDFCQMEGWRPRPLFVPTDPAAAPSKRCGTLRLTPCLCRLGAAAFFEPTLPEGEARRVESRIPSLLLLTTWRLTNWVFFLVFRSPSLMIG